MNLGVVMPLAPDELKLWRAKNKETLAKKMKDYRIVSRKSY